MWDEPFRIRRSLNNLIKLFSYRKFFVRYLSLSLIWNTVKAWISLLEGSSSTLLKRWIRKYYTHDSASVIVYLLFRTLISCACQCLRTTDWKNVSSMSSAAFNKQWEFLTVWSVYTSLTSAISWRRNKFKQVSFRLRGSIRSSLTTFQGRSSSELLIYSYSLVGKYSSRLHWRSSTKHRQNYSS